ncbi:MAG: hypothetical protein D6744_06085 [Planctomycetota bacterium]|nr:MAG: hypothetical protein D6744_06085 [Planctomycetota bacterium]
MTGSETLLVRGTCACGQRYRIRNAAMGLTVRCPKCGRAITITDADLRAAWAQARLQPVQPENVEAREAIPLDYGELRVAPRGSKPGLTGDEAYDHQEALMMRAMRGWSTLAGTDDDEVAINARPPLSERLAAPVKTRRYPSDVLASLYFAGNARSALIVLCSAVVVCAFLVLLLLPNTVVTPARDTARFVGAIALTLALAYLLHFWNAVLILTAEGREDAPWINGGAFLHDWLRPAVRILLVTACCLAPEGLARALTPDASAWRLPALIAAVAAGAAVWPMAILATTVKESLRYLRPDLVIRSIVCVGRGYWLAALVALMVDLAWRGAVAGVAGLPRLNLVFVILAPFGIVLAGVYFGYVLFRTVGLLYRHFHRTLPWRV